MSNSDDPTQLKFAPIFTVIGLMIIMLALVIGAFILAPTAASYYGDNSKAARDSASTGDALQTALVTLTSIPRWLEPLIFLGVAAFMVGIALLFSTIPTFLKERGERMSKAFNDIVRLKKQ